MSVLPVADAKAHLNITGAASDSKLQEFIDAAEAAINSVIGVPFGATDCDEWRDGGTANIQLFRTPVIAVTSVVECAGSGYIRTLTEQPLDSTSTDAFGYTIDKTDGTLVRRASGIAMPFLTGRRNIHVVYTAGYTSTTVPKDLLQADKELLRHLWMTQRGAGTRRPGSEIDVESPNAYSFPYRVQELLKPYMLPGVG